MPVRSTDGHLDDKAEAIAGSALDLSGGTPAASTSSALNSPGAGSNSRNLGSEIFATAAQTVDMPLQSMTRFRANVCTLYNSRPSWIHRVIN